MVARDRARQGMAAIDLAERRARRPRRTVRRLAEGALGAVVLLGGTWVVYTALSALQGTGPWTGAAIAAVVTGALGGVLGWWTRDATPRSR